jgi:hypothetical protein
MWVGTASDKLCLFILHPPYSNSLNIDLKEVTEIVDQKPEKLQ